MLQVQKSLTYFLKMNMNGLSKNIIIKNLIKYLTKGIIKTKRTTSVGKWIVEGTNTRA